MRNILHILLLSMSLFLMACTEENDNENKQGTQPPASDCTVHCAP